MIPIQEKVNIFDEIKRILDEKYELCVVEKTVEELKKLIEDKKIRVVDRMAAKIGLQLLNKNKIKKLKTEDFRTADSAILSIADKNTIVATRDVKFKRKLKKKNIGIISLKGKNLISYS